MASAIATATMAAAGFDKRPTNRPASLHTPASGTFPSEMLSPIPAGSPGLKKDDVLKTPITPPSAYLDFLRNCTPAMMSPASPATNTPRFTFPEKRSFDRISDEATSKPAVASPMSHLSLSRNSSYESTSTNSSSTTSTSSTTEQSSNSSSRNNSFSAACRRPGVDSPTLIIPPSPFAKPGPRSARTPRLRIPQSPYSPATGLVSAHSNPSPYSNTPLSAAPWSANPSSALSPSEPSQPARVSVRHVVTRTVTYCRTALDPAPRGKRRRVEEADSSSNASVTDSRSSHSRSSSASISTTTDEKSCAEEELTPIDTSTSHRANLIPAVVVVKQEKRESSEGPVSSPVTAIERPTASSLAAIMNPAPAEQSKEPAPLT